MSQEGSWCPNCGAPVELSPDTVVLICGYCGTAVSLTGNTYTLSIVECEDKGVVNNVLEMFVRERAKGGVLRDVKYLMVPRWVIEVEERRYRDKSSYSEYRPVRGTIRERLAVAVYGKRFEGLFGLGQVKYILLSRLEAAKPFDAEKVMGWSAIGSELE
ncbi:hypothetical protein CSUB_C0963 [Candidatus Caldarchaeum subterraneum]|uniref:Uncharacterized protein n=1 Tax=Caldiarchaeum subterraneum TaxID=311458 RepID=E6N6U7_CALS0|nr:hypothetical protein HGMM_F28E01C17 [Candidatus Caldarchaeum subterraneum]BAJ50816.1 hypothetical protein CSUB_C0963 [Candidatus Caldarchaeum subterraneum]